MRLGFYREKQNKNENVYPPYNVAILFYPVRGGVHEALKTWERYAFSLTREFGLFVLCPSLPAGTGNDAPDFGPGYS